MQIDTRGNLGQQTNRQQITSRDEPGLLSPSIFIQCSRQKVEKQREREREREREDTFVDEEESPMKQINPISKEFEMRVLLQP